ncbi:DUF4118 domain-containing protein [Nocardioides sp.]|uniref:DUF4118 domain-containing protein n=1 Tax=Nocardioides sp. TaxID=35761 RepID=UPI003D0BFDFD
MSYPQFTVRHRAWLIAASVGVPLLVCAGLSLFRSDISAATSVLVLVLLVVAAASTGDRAAGLVAAVSAGLWFDVFLTEPYGQLAIDDANDIEATVLLVLIGAAVTEVALWGHRHQVRSSRRAGYLDGVLGTVENVSLRHETPAALLQHICEQIELVLGVAQCRFAPGPRLDPRVALMNTQGVVTRDAKLVDVDRDGLPTDEYTAIRVSRGDTIVGHFILTAAGAIARPSLEQRKVAILLADQAGSVLENPAP